MNISLIQKSQPTCKWLFRSCSNSSLRASSRSRVLARLVSLAQIGELARRLQQQEKHIVAFIVTFLLKAHTVSKDLKLGPEHDSTSLPADVLWGSFVTHSFHA